MASEITKDVFKTVASLTKSGRMKWTEHSNSGVCDRSWECDYRGVNYLLIKRPFYWDLSIDHYNYSFHYYPWHWFTSRGEFIRLVKNSARHRVSIDQQRSVEILKKMKLIGEV